jgi:hypothetical protein
MLVNGDILKILSFSLLPRKRKKKWGRNGVGPYQQADMKRNDLEMRPEIGPISAFSGARRSI